MVYGNEFNDIYLERRFGVLVFLGMIFEFDYVRLISKINFEERRFW